jgi:hypothetical protein
MRRRPILIVTILAAVAVITGVSYVYWTRTPQYALAQIKYAFKTHDVMLFRQYVDLDTVVSRTVDTLLAETMKASTTHRERDSASTLGEAFAAGLIMMIKPRLVTILSENIERQIEHPGEAPQQKDNAIDILSPVYAMEEKAQKDNWRDFTVLDVSTHGSSSTVSVQLSGDSGTPTQLDLRFRKTQGGYWQLVEFANLPALLNREPAALASANPKDITIPPPPPEAADDYRSDPTCRRPNGRPCGTP